ncbi:MAG: hypothetical protein MUE98_00180 [Rhodobacteraceae bacterium]|jgi:hypothetical protein|nr:hypothetical protein [Paracoccaceae bacterium]
MTEKRVSVRLVAEGDRQVKAMFADLGRQGPAAFNQVGTAARNMAPQIQNAAFQVGDFAVQVAGGTSATRALAQQLPQLLGGFGVLGAVVGAAVAVLVPLAGRLFETEDAAERAKEQIDSLGEATEAYSRAAALAVSPIDELIKKYGDLADEVRAAQVAEAELARARALRAVTDTLDNLSTGFATDEFSSAQLSSQLAERERILQRLREAEAEYAAASAQGDRERQIALANEERQLRAQLRTLVDIREGLQNVSLEYGVTAEQSQALAVAIAGVREATSGTAAEQVAAATELRDLLLEAYGSIEEADAATDGLASNLNKAVIEAANIAATDIASPIGTAANEAARLASNLAAAGGAYNAELARTGQSSGPDSVRSQQFGGGVFAPRVFGSLLAAPPIRTGRRGGGGGGGAGGGRDPMAEMMREAERIYRDTRTEAEKLAIEEERLGELRRAGALDADTYNRALAKLGDEYADQGSLLRDVGSTVKGALGDVFGAIFDGGGKAIDVVKNLAQELATMALQSYAFQALAGLFPRVFGAGGSIPLIGSAMGNAFDGGRIVPFAMGGVVTGPTLFPMRGGTGLMGEAGPEAILPLTRIGGRLGVASQGSGGTVVQINNYTGAPVREERQRGPNGEDLVQVIVGEQMARGQFDRAQRSRYGLRPQAVAR